MHTGRESREQRMIARPTPIEWNEYIRSEGQDMNIIVGTRIDPDTGEVVSGELSALHEMARAAADAYVLADRARLDLAELQARVDEHIAQPDMSSIVGEYEQLSTKLDEETQK